MIGVRRLPQIHFQGNRPIEPDRDKANWSKTGNAMYYDTVPIQKWMFICDKQNERQGQEFVRNLMNLAKRKGLSMVQPISISFTTPNGRNPNPKMWKAFFTEYFF